MKPELAKSIVVDRPKRTVTINGQEFPYMVADEPIEFQSASSVQMGIIYLPILAQDVQFRETDDA